MLNFVEVVDWLRLYEVPKVTAVMDCCHAGMVARNLQLFEKFDGQYFLMASVNATSKALIDYGDEQPIGLFTRHFLQSFNNNRARAAQGREVTFASFYNHVRSRVTRTSKQEPYSRDNGVANEVFFRLG